MNIKNIISNTFEIKISIIVCILSVLLSVIGIFTNFSVVIIFLLGVGILFISIKKPINLLYIFIFLIPFEEITVLTESITILKLLGWLLLFFWVIKYIQRRIFPKITKGLIILFIFILWMLISYFWAYYPAAVLFRIPTLIQLFIMFWIIVDSINKKDLLNKAFWAYTIGSILVSLIASILFVGGSETIYGRAALGFSGSPNHLPLSIIPAFWWLWVNFLDNTVLYRKILLSILFIPLVLVLVFSASRGAIFALIGSGLISLVWKKSRRSSIVLISLVILSYGVLQYINDPNLLSRFSFDSLLNDRGAGRFDIWLVGLQIARNNLVFGVGLNGFAWVFGKYYEITQTIRVLSDFRVSHNIYLGILVDTGLIGLSIFLTFIIYEIMPLFKQFLNHESLSLINKKYILVFSGAFLGVFSLLIGGFGLDIIYKKYFWLIIAFCESCRFMIMRLDPKINRNHKCIS